MLNGYIPPALSLAEADDAARPQDPDEYVRRCNGERRCEHVEAMLELQASGAVTFDYGNNIRTVAFDAGLDERVRLPGVRAGVHPAAVLRGQGSVPLGRAVRRSRRHRAHGSARTGAVSGRRASRAMDHARARADSFSGTSGPNLLARPGRACAIRRRAQRSRRSGELSAPIVIGRDHLDTGSVASPFRETESMLDGSDAVADWPILNALVNTASGASWVSFHHGGGVGIGNSLHAGQVVVADGTPEMRERIERVLTNDPAMGVLRHADAGYDIAWIRRRATTSAFRFLEGVAIRDTIFHGASQVVTCAGAARGRRGAEDERCRHRDRRRGG